MRDIRPHSACLHFLLPVDLLEVIIQKIQYLWYSWFTLNLFHSLMHMRQFKSPKLCFATNTSFHWMETFTHLLVVYCFRLAEEQESQQGTDMVSPHQRRETFIFWQRQVSSAECRAQNCLSPWHRRTNTVPLAKDATGVWVLAELQSVWQEEGMCKSFSLLGDSRLCY